MSDYNHPVNYMHEWALNVHKFTYACRVQIEYTLFAHYIVLHKILLYVIEKKN